MFLYPTPNNRDFALSLKKRNPKLKVIRLEQSKFKGGPLTKVVNLGNFNDLNAFKTCTVVNAPKTLQKYSSKGKIFEELSGTGLCPKVIKDPQEALELLYEGETLSNFLPKKDVNSVAQIINSNNLSLYVKPSYISLYRVHITKTGVLGVDKGVKSSYSDYKFSVKNVGELPDGLWDFSKKCFNRLEGIDFCQLHIGYNAYKDSFHLDDIKFDFGNFCERINSAYIKKVLGLKPIKSTKSFNLGKTIGGAHIEMAIVDEDVTYIVDEDVNYVDIETFE